MPNSRAIGRELIRICDGSHEYQPLIDGRAHAAARYPVARCKAICRGIIKEKLQRSLDVRAVVEIQEGEHWRSLNLEENHEEEETESAQEAELNQDATEQPVNPQVTSDDQQSELYDEGFAAGRAAALSELEEQRLEHLAVLKSISEKLLTDSVFDFDNISKKVLDTVNELSSERCGLAIDENPEGFLKRIAAQIEQVRNLSEERSVFFNEEDLAALKSFEEFESYFAKAKVRSDPVLKRGDVVVKVGGVELRDAPFADYAQDIQDE